MALNGTIYTDVGSNYRLSIEWSATQSTTGNYSTVTAKMYWEADGYGYVNSGTTKDGAIVIDGTTYTFEGKGLADLNQNQKKLIATKSKTVYHNSEGEKSFSISGYFDAEVTLSNKYYGRISIASKTYSLNDIPRKSSLSSSPSFTSTENYNLTVSRSSSSFSHIAYIDVQNRDGSWQYIKSIEFSTSETTKSSSWNTTDNTRVFTALDGRSSAPMRINLNTYSGSTNLGYNTYTGTVTASKASIGYPVYGEAGADSYMYVDQTIGISIGRDNPTFTHKTEITLGSYTKTLTDITTGTTWTPNGTEQTALYNAIGTTSSSLKGRARTYTYYNGVQVRSYTDREITFFVRSSSNAPTFSATGITYGDVNAVTSAVTGDPLYLIQNKSSLRVTIPSGSKATGKNGATIKQYSVTINGVAKTVADVSGNLNIDYGVVNSSNNVTASIRAIDSRGLSTTVTLAIKVVPYSAPVMNYTVRRRNGFEDTVDLTLTGTISPVVINGSQTNGLQAISGTSSALQYRYRENVSGASFVPWKNFTFTPSGAAYTATPTTEVLDNTKAYVFELRVSDKISTVTITKNVASGKPIMFIDANMKTVAVNKFPSKPNGFEIEGDLRATKGLELYGKPYVTEFTATTPATTGWYRVAISESTSIGNNNATFEIYNPLSSYHSFTRLEAGVMWGRTAGVSLTQTSHSTFGASVLTKARIVYNTSWTGNRAYLEIYQDQARASTITVRIIGGVGWVPANLESGSTVPAGYTTSSELTFKSGISYPDQQLVYPVPSKGANYDDSGASYQRLAYQKDPVTQIVTMYGLMKDLVYGDVIIQLPVGYRPAGRLVFNVINADYARAGRIDVWNTGNVTVEAISGNWISLSGISFYAGT
ncbi:minor structural protein [Phage f2b1]|nr:minor structural protein [Phage f2b1]